MKQQTFAFEVATQRAPIPPQEMETATISAAAQPTSRNSARICMVAASVVACGLVAVFVWFTVADAEGSVANSTLEDFASGSGDLTSG